MEFKYIMMNDGERDIPFIFPQSVAHVNIVKAMRSLPENMERRVYWTLVSAGFIILDFPVTCYGESESCKNAGFENYKSRHAEDAMIIQLYQWQHGVFEPESAKILIDTLQMRTDSLTWQNK